MHLANENASIFVLDKFIANNLQVVKPEIFYFYARISVLFEAIFLEDDHQIMRRKLFFLGIYMYTSSPCDNNFILVDLYFTCFILPVWPWEPFTEDCWFTSFYKGICFYHCAAGIYKENWAIVRLGKVWLFYEKSWIQTHLNLYVEVIKNSRWDF